MSAIKAKAKVRCHTCGVMMSRQKTFRVDADTTEGAIEEARDRIDSWKSSLDGSNCRVCTSIIESMDGEGSK